MTVTVQHSADPGPLVTRSWRGFTGEEWQRHIDVRSFIQANYTPYEGDAAFLAGPTERTRTVWKTVTALFPEERRKGCSTWTPPCRPPSPPTRPATSTATWN